MPFIYLGSPTCLPPDVQLFEVFSDQVASIIANRQDLPAEDMVSLEVALVNLAHKCYPDRVDYVDKVMQNSIEVLFFVPKSMTILETKFLKTCFFLKVFKRLGLERFESNTLVAKELQKLLKIPIDNYNNLLTVLKLQHYAELMQHLDYYGRKMLSIYILNNALDSETLITTQEQVEQALNLVKTLVSDQSDQPKGEVDLEELAEEQGLLARFIHQFKSTSADQQYLVLSAARKVIIFIFVFNL